MAQISKKPIPFELQKKIDESFYKAIGHLNAKEARFFIGDLLTRTERVMIPKRLAIAILLTKGRSYDSIRETLAVTQTTIASVARVLESSSGLKLAIEKLRKDAAWESWWQGVENMLYRFSSGGRVFQEEDAISVRLGHRRKTLV